MEIVEELWGRRAPEAAVRVVQNYIVGLRKSIAVAAGTSPRDVANEILVTHPTGYALLVGADDVDALQFSEVIRIGSRLLTSGEVAAAAATLHDALAMWRGSALADVDQGSTLAAEAERLTVARVLAAEQRINADLQLGRHYEVLSELDEYVEAFPLCENFHWLYMKALAATGRRHGALRAYERLRGILAAELQVDPTVEVRSLRDQICGGVGADDLPNSLPVPVSFE